MIGQNDNVTVSSRPPKPEFKIRSRASQKKQFTQGQTPYDNINNISADKIYKLKTDKLK